ncbi:uncharacterized protein E0L32_009494 [Thyridium curvatum]|uniref:Uncharacterized protein n=1 Tax=Thyridium curvatum TaxID=1093900 RepID=A0A507AIZ4_9PEZI|nr:uncharacterized protein E0L32_009494 [Thyridium curvatum]TPX09302.1 hypothetical protein E0L32_009494 [Thyridium curvatum]
MAAAMANTIVSETLKPRQSVRFDDDVPFWWTEKGYIVKWAIFASLFGILTLWICIGYVHARARLRKGLRPLWYHRWLVSRAELARVDPRYAYPRPTGYYTYRPHEQDYYAMNNMPPPPVYDAAAARPPVYEGPSGGSKVAPSQWAEGAPPPPGPPPAAHQPQRTGVDDFAPPPGPPPAGRS